MPCCRRDALRAGKRLLKEDGAAAMIRFEKALMLSKQLQDKVRARGGGERRADAPLRPWGPGLLCTG